MHEAQRERQDANRARSDADRERRDADRERRDADQARHDADQEPHGDALVDAVADACAAARARIGAEDAAIIRSLARAWTLAAEQSARSSSRDSAAREMPLRSIAARIAVELRLNDRTVQSRMYDAFRLTSLFPATVTALETGRISKAHADVVLDAGAALDDTEVRTAFEAVVLEWAGHETVARARAYAASLAARLDGRDVEARHAGAAEGRRVSVIDLDDGMSEIIARVPTALAHGIRDRLTRQARQLAAASAPSGRGDDDPDAIRDERTPDQMRADLFTDLLLTGAPAIDPTGDLSPGGLGAVRASVQLTVPVTTLTGVTTGGAELDGRAPVDPQTARRLAADAPVWERVLVDPVSATVVAVDRYRPTPAQRRFLHARDRHCRFPGCRMPARRCQIDHNDEWHDGGVTRLDNLACLCVRHHTMKSETDWTVRQLPGGSLEWTTPSGRTHHERPQPRVLFLPDDDPPDRPAPF